MALRAASIVAILLLWMSPAAAKWAAWPPGPTDSDLETMVRAAYSAASKLARSNVNYFARDGEFLPLHNAVAAALAHAGYADVAIANGAVPKLEALVACAAGEGGELRIGLNAFGDGISLAAVSDSRVFSYHYDPHENAAIVVKPAEACTKP